MNVRPPTEDQGWNLRALASSSVDDVLTLGARLLRRAHPRLKQNEWAALISAAALAGDHTWRPNWRGRLEVFPADLVGCERSRKMLYLALFPLLCYKL